jgi:hypothetical protein
MLEAFHPAQHSSQPFCRLLFLPAVPFQATHPSPGDLQACLPPQPDSCSPRLSLDSCLFMARVGIPKII